MGTIKSDDQKISIEALTVLKTAFFYSIGAAVVIAAMLIKLTLVDQIFVENPLPAFILWSAGLAFIMAVFFVYAVHSRRTLVASSKYLYAVTAAIVLTYISNIFIAVISEVLMPVFLASFIIAPISKRRDAFMGNIIANLLVLYTLVIAVIGGADYSLQNLIMMSVIGIAAGSVAAYTVSANTKRTSYILKGFLIGVCALVFIVLYGYVFSSRENMADTIQMAAIGVFIPLILGLILQPIFESVFNLVTNSRLVELTDHNSPLIKRMREETPGTFNHCLAVANFAEICAAAIGENPYLARACAYYHDVGKLVNSAYFKENQGDINPHDDLLPEVSADIIRLHTTEGLKLCQEYRIPQEVSHVTVQHHGTLLIPVFFNKACKLTDSTVNPYDYSYHGTTPVSKEAAIIMLCDVSEAAIRAMDSPDGDKVDRLLTSLINERIAAGQFDNCDISLRELDTIKRAIINSYGGLFHKRMQYPGGDKKN